MSLTSIVNNRESFLWSMMTEKDLERLRRLSLRLSHQLSNNQVFLPQRCANNELMTVGMAMRYALMYTFGAKHLRTHPMSTFCHKEGGQPFFDDIVNQFGSKTDDGLLFLALLDHAYRSHSALSDEEEGWYQKGLVVNHGKRKLPTSENITAALNDISILRKGMKDHFAKPNLTGMELKCLFCGTIQIPKSVWSCSKCGAPLIYNPIMNTSASIEDNLDTEPHWLCPTLAEEIGGADAPLSVGWKLFSVRTVKRPVVTPEHLLMAWGWWALYRGKDCPPWETATIYYARQQAEITFELRSFQNMFSWKLEQFQRILISNYDYDEEDIFHVFEHDDWGDR